MQWIEIEIKLPSKHLEEMAARFFEMGIDGLQEDKDCFRLFFPEDQWSAEKRYFLEDFLGQFTETAVDDLISIKNIQSENWLENWKDNFKLFHLTKNIVISPDWIKYRGSQQETVLTISPKMAFGTGHHETTQLLLELMEDQLSPGISVLDAGTGSGILAIYAAKRGAAPVVAFDTDPVAMENVEENIILNKVEKKIDYFTGELHQAEGQKFDLILANINRNVLLDLAPQWAAGIKSGGTLMISGLLESDGQAISSAYEDEGWKLMNTKRKNEWKALVFKRDE